MRDVVLIAREGPMRGREIRLSLGRVSVGREAGAGGVSLPGDATVSRVHGELFEEDGRVVYRNLSANGTVVDGAVVKDTVVVTSGTELRIGTEHLFVLRYEAPTAATGKPGGLLASGPLASPVVRAVLVLYLLGLVGLVIFLRGRGGAAVERDFATATEAYQAGYQPAGLDDQEKARRLERAAQLVAELRAFERAEQWGEARQVCREIMGLDADPSSPLYRFAARRLGALGGRR